MKRVIYYILLALLLSAPAQAQGWRGSVNGQELFSGAAARPQINNGPTLGTSSYFWLALYVKNINFGTGGVLLLPDGLAGTPSLAFTLAPTRGIFNDTAALGLGFAVAGSRVAFLSASQFKTVGASMNIDASLLALGPTSTDGFITENTTAATVGTTVQISPRSKWCGAAYNSVSTMSETDCWIQEVLPVTVAGATTASLVLSRSIAGGAYAERLRYTDAGSLIATSGANLGWSGRTVTNSPADGLYQVMNQSQTFGPQFNVGTATPTVTACGTGAVTAHSSNTAGEVTATGATTCTLTFGLPNFTNQPFCVIEDESTIAATRISAISVSAFTVTGLTSGDKFMFHCIGGI